MAPRNIHGSTWQRLVNLGRWHAFLVVGAPGTASRPALLFLHLCHAVAVTACPCNFCKAYYVMTCHACQVSGVSSTVQSAMIQGTTLLCKPQGFWPHGYCAGLKGSGFKGSRHRRLCWAQGFGQPCIVQPSRVQGSGFKAQIIVLGSRIWATIDCAGLKGARLLGSGQNCIVQGSRVQAPCLLRMQLHWASLGLQLIAQPALPHRRGFQILTH